MKTKKKLDFKTFDAVNFMREQRDRITKDIINLSPEEIVKYFKKSQKKDSLKQVSD